ncbi:MAG: O-antigen ligase family protein [Patescibacteria group bacterium]
MTINTILRNSIIGGIFLVLIIPFIVTNSLFFPFITGKGFVFRILVEILFGAWLILAVTDKRYRPQKSFTLIAVGALLGVMAIADATGLNPFKSFWSNFERMEGLIGLLHLGAYFLVVSTVIQSEKIWNWFWNTTIAASVLMCFYGVMQLTGMYETHQGDRLDATLGNASYLAVYLLIHIFITAYLVVSRRYNLFGITWINRQAKILVGAAIILVQSFILYRTETRGALIGLVVGVLFTCILLLILGARKSLLRRTAGGILIATIVIVGGFILVRNTSFVQNNPQLQRFASISLSDTTTKSRLLLWNMAIEGFKERPVFGWGQENFNYVFNTNYNPELYGQEQWFDRTHNVIFDWLIAGGILGLLSYLGIYAALLWYIWRKESVFTVAEKSVLTGLLTAYFIHNIAVFDNLISYIFFFTLAAYITQKSLPKQTHDVFEKNRIIAPVALVATIAMIYFVNVPSIRTNLNLIQAISQQGATVRNGNDVVPFNGDVAPNIEYFRKALAYRSIGTQEVREQLLTTAERIHMSPYQIKGNTDIFALAFAEGKNQIAETPKDARAYVIMGGFSDRVARHDDAIVYLTEAQKLSPRKQVILFQLGATYIAKKDYEKALPLFKQAYELAPQFDDARLTYAAAAIYAGEEKLTQELISTFTPEFIAGNDTLLQAYFEKQKFDKILEIWKTRVAKDPMNAKARLSLAAAHLYLNDTKSAVIEIQKAVELDPTFKEQGDLYIKDIRAGKNPVKP